MEIRERRTNNICESFHRTLNNIINHYHPKVVFLVDKLKFFACDAYKKYSTAMVGTLPDSKKETKNIAMDIYDFIKKFHINCNEFFDIEKLNKYILKENKEIVDICKNFLDIIFTDGDLFICNLEENEENNNIWININEENHFEKEEFNLTEKLNKLNIENENLDNFHEDIFEEEETLNEYENINYVKKPNGTKKFKASLSNNLINKLYLLKKNK